MRQHIEIIGKGSRLKETRTAKGWLYSLSLPITSTDRDGQELTEWLSCSIFQKDRRPELLEHTGEFHLIGELRVQAAWNDRPQKLSLFGFHIEPVMGRVWRVAGKRKKPEGQETEKPASNPSRPQPTEHEPPLLDFSDEEDGPIPF